MKITKSQLKQIIKEELEAILNEQRPLHGPRVGVAGGTMLDPRPSYGPDVTGRSLKKIRPPEQRGGRSTQRQAQQAMAKTDVITQEREEWFEKKANNVARYIENGDLDLAKKELRYVCGIAGEGDPAGGTGHHDIIRQNWRAICQSLTKELKIAQSAISPSLRRLKQKF